MGPRLRGDTRMGLVGGGELAGGLEGHFFVAAENDAVSPAYAEDEGAALLAGVTFS